MVGATNIKRALEYVLLSDEEEHKATIGGPLLAAIRKHSAPSEPLSKHAAIAPARNTLASTSSRLDTVASTSAKAPNASASLITTPPSSRVKHLSTAHSPLSEKATALGMGTFPQASLSAVRCERITEFTNSGMTIQFGPERLIINIDKNVTKIGHDNLKIVEVFFDGDPKVLVISLHEKLPESSILADYYDPAPHSGKARKIILLCSCDAEIIQGYCKRLSKKKIQVKPLSLFSFPFKKTAKSKSIAVHVEDISRLDEGEFLNDTLIEFGLRYIHSNLEALNSELANQTYIFNSFFYERLLAKPGKGMSSSYDGIKSWTNKIDIFSKKFIIVPIHESMHWYLAIITNPGLLLLGADMNETCSDTSPQADFKIESDSKSTPASPADSDPVSPSATDGSILPSSVAKKESRIGNLFSTVDKLLSPRKALILEEDRPVVRRSSRSTSSAVPVDAEAKPYILVLDSLGGVHATVTKTLRSYLQQELSARKNIVRNIDPRMVPGKHAKNNKKEEADKYWAVEELAHKREQYRKIVISLTEEYHNFQGRP
ncbi:hypothetical protein EC968_008030 [Mortierella alpina]|nr:hypothetical protein EC968_008030 [Mortierella alpina]